MTDDERLKLVFLYISHYNDFRRDSQTLTNNLTAAGVTNLGDFISNLKRQDGEVGGAQVTSNTMYQALIDIAHVGSVVARGLAESNTLAIAELMSENTNGLSIESFARKIRSVDLKEAESREISRALDLLVVRRFKRVLTSNHLTNVVYF